MKQSDPIDAVFTWVDDSQPGYRDLLNTYAGTGHDRNPNRTRDNLNLIKYSIRALCLNAPWIRTVYIVSCRPQKPVWLASEHPGLIVVHHDEFMDPSVIPTFNSFAIMSYLADIPGLSRRFLHFDDDMLLNQPTSLGDFFTEDGHLVIHTGVRGTRPAKDRHSNRLSPWNTSLAHSNWLLDQTFGRKRRGYVHAPLLIDRDIWGEMLTRWPADVDRTRSSRFRAKYNIAPEHLYVQYLRETGWGVDAGWRTYRDTFYHGIENFLLWDRVGFNLAQWLNPRFLTLNDNFGADPNPAVVDYVIDRLERRFPDPSRFERLP